MSDPCPICGKNRVMVGYRHLCVPVSTSVNTEERVNTTPAEGVNTTRRADRHSAGYMATYMRRKRQAARALKRSLATKDQAGGAA